MWLFLLLPWFSFISNAERIGSHVRLATAVALKLECESMQYRSYFEGNTCYFAIHAAVKHSDANGDANCRSTLRGAKARYDKDRNRVLRLLFLDPSTYHDATTAGQWKNMLCALEIPYTCEHGDQSLPGKCVIRSEKPITWHEASNFCRSKGASGVVIHNEDENGVIAGILGRNEKGWLLPGHGRIWSAEDDKIDYWKWFFEAKTPADLKCSGDSQHAIITKTAKTTCSTYGLWMVDYSKNKNIALCSRDAECPLCPPPKKVPPPDTTTTTTTTTTVATTTTTTRRKDQPATAAHLWSVNFYYNFGVGVHAYCADWTCINAIQGNGIGYNLNSGSGSIGRAVSESAIGAVRYICPLGSQNLRNLGFEKSGKKYLHNLQGRGLKQGWVSLVRGSCGSSVTIKRWMSRYTDDMMYGVDLEWNTWYKGMVQNGGQAQFYMWNSRPFPFVLRLIYPPASLRSSHVRMHRHNGRYDSRTFRYSSTMSPDSSPLRIFSLPPSPSLSPIRSHSPPPPPSRPPSVLDKTHREIQLDSPYNSPNASPRSPASLDDVDISSVIDDQEMDTVSTPPHDTVPSTPDRFSDPHFSYNTSPVSSHSPELPVKRRRLDFSDNEGNDDGMDSDSGEVNDDEEEVEDEDEDSESSRPNDEMLSDENEDADNNEALIEPQNKAELFFTMRFSNNVIHFFAPFTAQPLMMRVKYPPRNGQIEALRNHGFEHADHLMDKKRFRNIGFRYELDCPAYRLRELVDLTLTRLERIKEDQECEREHARDAEREERSRRRATRRLFDEYSGSSRTPSESDSRSEPSSEGKDDLDESNVSTWSTIIPQWMRTPFALLSRKRKANPATR